MATQTLMSPAIVAAQPSWRQYAASFNCRIGLLTLILVPVDLILAGRVHLYGLLQYTFDWPVLVILLWMLLFSHLHRSPRLIDTCELAVWGLVLYCVLTLLIQIAARSPYPLADRQLDAIDLRMHFQTAPVLHIVARLPYLDATLNWAYGLVSWFVVAAILLPPLFGHTVAARRFVIGIVLASIVTAILFTFVPAAGPWITQSLPLNPKQAAVTAYLRCLKSPGPVRLDLVHDGIVAIPSFHVVYVVLSAAALSSIRWLRTPVWILATLVCISTITTGWHYGIDVLAGFILSAFVLWLARQIEPDGWPGAASLVPPSLLRSFHFTLPTRTASNPR